MRCRVGILRVLFLDRSTGTTRDGGRREWRRDRLQKSLVVVTTGTTVVSGLGGETREREKHVCGARYDVSMAFAGDASRAS